MAIQNIQIKMHVKSSKPRVEVLPGSDLFGGKNDIYHVYVGSAPEKGQANKELLQLLSKSLGVSKFQLAIIKGHTSRTKLIQIND